MTSLYLLELRVATTLEPATIVDTAAAALAAAGLTTLGATCAELPPPPPKEPRE